MYVVAEEANEDIGGNVVIVSSVWQTPRKTESFWPNCKFSVQYNKLLLKHEHPAEDWQMTKLKRKFFETDDIILARKKAKEAEVVSDVTDGEEIVQKRKIKPPKRIPASSSSDEDDGDIFSVHKLAKTYKNPVSSMPTEELSVLTTPRNQVRSKSVSADDFCGITPAQNSAASLSAFEHKSLRLIATIVEQNNQILNWIRQQNEYNTKNTKDNHLELPVQFPLHLEDELKMLETHLENDNNLTELCNYFTSFVAIFRTGTVNTILKHCLTNKLASKYSYRGKKGKLAFEGLSRTALICTGKRLFKLPTERDIENDIKIYSSKISY